MHIKDVSGKNVKCGECGVLFATRRLVCENATETIYLCDECFGDVSKFLTRAKPLLDTYWSKGEKLPLLANCDEEPDEDRVLIASVASYSTKIIRAQTTGQQHIKEGDIGE